MISHMAEMHGWASDVDFLNRIVWTRLVSLDVSQRSFNGLCMLSRYVFCGCVSSFIPIPFWGTLFAFPNDKFPFSLQFGIAQCQHVTLRFLVISDV